MTSEVAETPRSPCSLAGTIPFAGDIGIFANGTEGILSESFATANRAINFVIATVLRVAGESGRRVAAIDIHDSHRAP